ncbi:MAG TPA: aldehyde dehydrogenase family protein [Lacunisphaera sp.]|nr:aldehyde dehydrogenase family protein [Lacunisphaera sp.]
MPRLPKPMTNNPVSEHLCTSYIAGHWSRPGNRVVERENPGRSAEVAARWCPARPDEAHRAMGAAAGAFAAWAAVPLPERLDRLEALLPVIARHAGEFVGLITRENGKPRRDAQSEIDAGLRDAAHALAEARQLGVVERTSAAGAAVTSELVLEPVGVQLLVTPWNFPLATILRKLVPALAYGNTVVVKPSELTPGPARRLFELLEPMALPAGTASLVLGFGAEIGPVLAAHPALRGISCTGSTATGQALARATAGRDVRLQLEMGGKNSLVVLADARLDEAVEAAVIGAFSCAGQWCTGTGRVIVEQAVSAEFVARLAARAAQLHVGPGDDEHTDTGPVVSAERVQVAREAVAAAVAAGARVHCGGREPPGGHFFAPTVLDRVCETMPVFLNELFVPVLPVIAARDADDAIRLANTGTFGLSASVFSSNVERARTLARRIEAGIVHVNLHTAYREPSLPVAGWRDSGHGLPECGRYAREFFTRPRALYTRLP